VLTMFHNTHTYARTDTQMNRTKTKKILNKQAAMQKYDIFCLQASLACGQRNYSHKSKFSL